MDNNIEGTYRIKICAPFEHGVKGIYYCSLDWKNPDEMPEWLQNDSLHHIGVVGWFQQASYFGTSIAVLYSDDSIRLWADLEVSDVVVFKSTAKGEIEWTRLQN